MTNARLKALKDNFRGLSAGATIASAANALSSYATSLNTALSNASPMTSFGSPDTGPVVPSSAAPVPTVKAHPLDTVEGDIVVLGGYRGSILRETKGARRRVWIPLKVGLNLRKVNLEIGLNPEDEETMAERIVPDGMLTHIGPVDIGRRLLKRLRQGEVEPVLDGKALGRKVHEWGYDWRLSPARLSKQLIEFLEKLPCNRDAGQSRGNGRGALVIAHSLGGLITRHAMNQRPELFSGVLFVGTPQQCVNILGPLRNGDTVMLSSKVLSAQVNFTIRSSFALLPLEGHCFVDKTTGEKYPVDFFDVNTWIKYALSPCVSRPQPAPMGQRNRSASVEEAVKLVAVPAVKPGRAVVPQMESFGGLGVGLSPFSPLPGFLEEGGTTLSLAEAIPYLERTLMETKKFKEELVYRPEIGYPDLEAEKEDEELEEIEEVGQEVEGAVVEVKKSEMKVGYPPMGIVYAKNTPTVKGAKIDGMESIILDNVYEELVFGAGKPLMFP